MPDGIRKRPPMQWRAIVRDCGGIIRPLPDAICGIPPHAAASPRSGQLAARLAEGSGPKPRLAIACCQSKVPKYQQNEPKVLLPVAR